MSFWSWESLCMRGIGGGEGEGGRTQSVLWFRCPRTHPHTTQHTPMPIPRPRSRPSIQLRPLETQAEVKCRWAPLEPAVHGRMVPWKQNQGPIVGAAMEVGLGLGRRRECWLLAREGSQDLMCCNQPQVQTRDQGVVCWGGVASAEKRTTERYHNSATLLHCYTATLHVQKNRSKGKTGWSSHARCARLFSVPHTGESSCSSVAAPLHYRPPLVLTGVCTVYASSVARLLLRKPLPYPGSAQVQETQP